MERLISHDVCKNAMFVRTLIYRHSGTVGLFGRWLQKVSQNTHFPYSLCWHRIVTHEINSNRLSSLMYVKAKQTFSSNVTRNETSGSNYFCYFASAFIAASRLEWTVNCSINCCKWCSFQCVCISAVFVTGRPRSYVRRYVGALAVRTMRTVSSAKR